MICRFKEGIVEIDHIRKRAVIGIQVFEGIIVLQVLLILTECRFAFVFGQCVDFGQIHNLFHLTTAKTIDGLLAVANNHTHIARRQAVVNQRQKVLPLQHRSVLELIHKDMTEIFANALIHKWNREIAHHRVEQLVELRNMNHLLLVGQLLKLHPDLGA